MRLDSDHSHGGSAAAAHTYAGLTMPVAWGQEFDEGYGQNKLSIEWTHR
jgi:hypothetical protein